MNPRKIELIDERNEKLWDTLNLTNSIDIEFWSENHYACDSQEFHSIILIPENDICIDSFTHELLHILLRSKKIFIGSNFKLSVLSDENLSELLSYELIEHFGNCLDHIKMLPMYLELGFDKRKFTSDYEINKCTKAEIQKLKESYRSGKYYSKEAVDFYFGKYIAIKADAKNHINYPKSLSELKKLDFQLFSILEEYVNNWKNLPLVTENAWDDNYGTVTSTFCDNLKVWIGDKDFI